MKNEDDAQRLSLGKFKNKRIRIDGRIDTISKQHSLIYKELKKIVVCLRDVIVNKGELFFSHLWIEISQEELEKISFGKKVSLTGEVYGYCRNSGIRGFSVKNVRFE